MGPLARIVAVQTAVTALMAGAGMGVQYLRTPSPPPPPPWRPHPSNEVRQWGPADLAHFLAGECPGAKPDTPHDPTGVRFPDGTRLTLTKFERGSLAREATAGPSAFAWGRFVVTGDEGAVRTARGLLP